MGIFNRTIHQSQVSIHEAHQATLNFLFPRKRSISTLEMSKDAVSIVLVEPVKEADSSESSSLNQNKTIKTLEEITIVSSPDISENELNVKPEDLATEEAAAPQSSELKRPEGMALFLLTTGMMMSIFIMSLDQAIIGKFTFILSDFSP